VWDIKMWNIIGTSVLAATEAAETTVPASQWWTTAGVVGVLLVLLIAFTYWTRSGVIARATTKEAVRQPVFLLMLGIGLVVLVLNTFLPFFSLGEDVKMQKDCGLATILIAGLLLAIWTASTSIAAEIEGKTAMTLLSKPVNRRQFIVGKYMGIVNAILMLWAPLSMALLFLICYKVGYDAKESSQPIPDWFEWATVGGMSFELPTLTADRLDASVHIIPGLLLILLETMVLASVSVAISTRAPMIVNMTTCFTIFVIGHLTPMLVKANVLKLEFVQFMAQLIATVLPALEIFNMQGSVATGTIVPPDYLGFSAIYCAAYCGAAILLAFILFEDRDLA